MKYFINEEIYTAEVVIDGISYPIDLDGVRGDAASYIENCKSGMMIGIPHSLYSGDVELSKEEFLAL